MARGYNAREASSLVHRVPSFYGYARSRWPQLWDGPLDPTLAEDISFPSRPAKITNAVRAGLRKAAALVVEGKTYAQAEDILGLRRNFLCNTAWRHRAVWEAELDQASDGQREAIKEARRKTPAENVAQRIRQVLRIVAAGKTLTEAAGVLGIDRKRLYEDRRRFHEFWDAEDAVARTEIEALGMHADRGPGQEVLDGIRKATALTAAGEGRSEIAERLGIKISTLEHWQRHYADAWKDELGRAMEAALILVQRHAGTEALSEDPAAYLRRALVCDRWAQQNGRQLFAKPDELTLCTFFESHYRPTRLQDGSSETVRSFRNVLRRWRLLTGDPPLKEITHSTLTHFRDCLAKMRGQKRASRLSGQSIRRYFTCIECLLNKAGPAGYRNRDAAGLIPSAPWIKKPKPEAKPVRIVTPDELSAVYTAAVAIDKPRIPGFKPAAWWRALLAVVRNTGLRRRALLQMRMEHVNWTESRLDLPRELLKSGRAFSIHLNRTALEHLRKIRTDRDLVFSWPHSEKTFYACWHKLQTEAGIPKKRHFGLHDLRKTLGTILWEDSPAAAQWALGHSSPEVTRRHYVDGMGLVARALDRMVQPEAFTVGIPSDPSATVPEAAVSLEEARAMLARGRQMQEEAARLIESLGRSPARLAMAEAL
jgi:DNA-binding CsgD family transcriptional regulator